MPEVYGNQRYFGCVNIIGCKDVVSEGHDLRCFETVIDRNMIMCEPTVFTKIKDIDVFYLDLKRLHLEYLFALGIKRSREVDILIKEITLDGKR